MSQPVRQTNLRPQAFWETVQDRIDAANAVKVINKVVSGKQYKKKPITVMQATMAWNIVNKLVPSVAQIAVEVSHVRTNTLTSLVDRANALNVDPTALLGQPIESKGESLDSVPEETDSIEDSLEAPLPPDVDA
jgi:hypothetical protein